MYVEKVIDNIYGIDFVHGAKNFNGIRNLEVVHLIVHHTDDEANIYRILEELLKKGCKVFHFFGEYSRLWIDALTFMSDDNAVWIDYDVRFEEFVMDTATHFIEETNLRRYPWYCELKNRRDYVLYDDDMFFMYLKEDLQHYMEA